MYLSFRDWLQKHFEATRNGSAMHESPSTTETPGFASSVSGHLGMAIDYRIRYYFAVTPREHLAAWYGVVLATWYIRSQKPTSFSDGCTM